MPVSSGDSSVSNRIKPTLLTFPALTTRHLTLLLRPARACNGKVMNVGLLTAVMEEIKSSRFVPVANSSFIYPESFF